MQPADIARHAVLAFAGGLLAACSPPSVDPDPELIEGGVAHAATGRVESVDRGANAAVIHHDPVVSIGMPEMTMTFRLADQALAERLHPGERTAFDFIVDDGVVVISVHGTDADDSR